MPWARAEEGTVASSPQGVYTRYVLQVACRNRRPLSQAVITPLTGAPDRPSGNTPDTAAAEPMHSECARLLQGGLQHRAQ